MTDGVVLVSVAQLDDLDGVLACPACGSALSRDAEGYRCSASTCPRHGSAFPWAGRQPVLVDFTSSVLVEEEVVAAAAASPVSRERGWLFRTARRRLVPPNRVAERQVAELRRLALERSASPLVLVVGGGRVGDGVQPLYDDPAVRVLAFDVYASPSTGLVADGHRIPLADGSVDAVVVQGVLSVVVDPSQVAAEIHRVLRPEGLLYAEAAFVQQVCEGPYDFMRFTDSGLRHLFRRFTVLDSGSAAGPGTQLLTALDHLARGLFRSRTAGAVVKALLFWLRLLDRAVPEDYAVDASATVFLLGRRATEEVDLHEVLRHYRGAQRPVGGPAGSTVDGSGR